jgi:hypothetical protein
MATLTLGWIDLAAVVGSLQGLLLAGVLLAQRSNRTANRLLAALMISFTIYLASTAYYATGLYRVYPHFFGASYPMPWLFGPLVYLYAVAASDRAWHFRQRHWIHFAPAVIAVLVSFPFYAMSGADKVAMYARFATGDVPMRFVILEPTKFISGISYSIATVLYLRRHARTMEESYSNVARVNLRWLLLLAGTAAATWALATGLEVFGPPQRTHNDYVALAIAIVIYAIGYMGLRQPEVFRYQTAEFAAVPPEPAIEPRYERSGLAAAEAK